MKRLSILFLVLLTLFGLSNSPARAQPVDGSESKSAKKAFALSLLLPGLGHRYVHDGSWRGAASLFAAADVGLWVSLIGTQVRYGQTVDNYETLAASKAGAIVEGKNRGFFLNIATYRSSDEYVEVNLRERAWDQLDYVNDRSYQWKWETEADFLRFRSLREDAESLRRRRPLLVTMLVGNRLLAGLTSIRAAYRADGAAPATLSLSLPPAGGQAPMVNLKVRM